MKQETIVLNETRNVKLTAYIQGVGNEFSNIQKRPAVLIFPGGGYRFCSDREADPVAFEYLKAGYQGFVLHYSVGKHAVWPNPLEDYEQAMKLIRSNSEEWHIYPDKIAVVGFSAGGHLACCAAAISEEKPNAAIMGYPAILDDFVSLCIPGAPNVIESISINTCPCFVFATRTDTVVPINNSLKLIDALNQNNIAFESHIYAFGPHGFSTGNSSVQDQNEICNRLPGWVKDSIAWLKDMLGDFGDSCMKEPRCKPRIEGDKDAYLSVQCTIGHVMGNDGGRALLIPLFSNVKSQMTDADAGENMSMTAGAIQITVRQALQFIKIPNDQIETIDQSLREIPNHIN